MRCLVTGASGQLGSYLVRHLLEQDHMVSALVRPQSNLWRLSDVLDRIAVIKGDLIDLAPASEGIREARPEVCFHLAWHGVSGEHRNDEEQITRNVVGSLELLRIARSAGCTSWAGVGSQAEYGPYTVPLTEDLPTRPVTAYGVSKLSVGMLTQKLSEIYGLRHLWLRLTATYGPKDDDQHLIPSVITQLLARRRPVLTLGKQWWDYLYVQDAAEAICHATIAAKLSGLYNLGSGTSCTVRSIVEDIRGIIDPTFVLAFGEIPYGPDQVMFLTADIGKLQKASGWRPTVGMTDGLRHTIDWYRGSERPK